MRDPALRISQEQARCCKDYDEGREKLQKLYRQLRLKKLDLEADAAKMRERIEPVLHDGATPPSGFDRLAEAYLGNQAELYKVRLAMRLAYPAVADPGESPVGRPLGTPLTRGVSQ